MNTVKVHVFKECNLRTGGHGVPPRPHEPDNVAFRIQPGRYEAYYQCAGPQAQEGHDRNFWWVLIKVAQEVGWVSAICISTGGNDLPIPDVPIRAVEYVADLT